MVGFYAAAHEEAFSNYGHRTTGGEIMTDYLGDGPPQTDWDKQIIAEARVICLSYCRAAHCIDDNRCRNIWPGPGGTLWMYFSEAAAQLRAKEDLLEQQKGNK